MLVRATEDQVAAALRNRGLAGVQALAAAPSSATALVWISPGKLDAGATISFSYQLKLKPGATAVGTTNRVIGQSSSDR